MKKFYVLLICLFSGSVIWAQAILTNASPTLTIDFSSSMPASVGSNPSTAFAGAGFEPNTTTAGRLNSNAWASTGMSDGSLAFGGSRTTGDYARGAVSAAQTTGGFYAYTGLPNSAADPALMIQPGGSDFTPGTLTLRIQNNGTSSITQLDVSYNIYIRNDQLYSGSFNFSYSADDGSYTAVPALDYTSPAAPDANGWVVVPGSPSRSTSITGINVLPGAYFYIRWSGDDVSGSGSRDEFGLDDISLAATYGVASTPDVALSSPNPAVAAANIAQGSSNQPIYRFDLAVTTANATLNGVTVNTAGTYAATDFNNFRCWYSADNVFDAASDVLLSTLSPVGTAGAQVFPSFTNQAITSGSTGYIFITANTACAAALNNISVNAITTADISFVSANKSGTAFAGDLQTIVAAVPGDARFPAASVGNASTSVSWSAPLGCYDEVMIIASATAPNSGGTPTGDGTAYTANLVYGSGTAYGNGFVVYKGNASPQVVTNLVNGTTYYIKFYTRFGTTWSTNTVEVNTTPAMVTNATDYFRSVGSGEWDQLTTWQSSPDSSTWIAATLFPSTNAAHVVIQSPDSVWLTANRSTKNFTLRPGAKFNALTFSLTASTSFALEGNAAFYQGGTSATVPGGTGTQSLSATSNYHFNGVQNGASGNYPEFGNLYWEPAATGNGTMQNNVAAAPFNNGFVVRGNLTINLQSAAPFEVRFGTGSSTSRRHIVDGDLNVVGANTILVVNNGSVLSSIAVGGNINVNGAVLRGVNSSGQAIINLKGNLNNNGGSVVTGAGSGSYSFNYTGTAAQSINNTGGTFLYDVNQVDSINNSSSGGVTLNTPITHGGTIHFINGILTTSATNLLTMDAGSSVAETSNASFVNGPVSKIGNTDFVFPVGKLNTGTSGTAPGYAPITISNFVGGTLTDRFTAEYIRGNAAALGAVTAVGLNHVSHCDYWTLNRDAGTATVDLKLNWNDAINNCSGTYIDNLPSLVVAHFNGTNWDSYGATGTATGTNTAGDVSWPGVSVFSPFSIASIDFNNPLPIAINYFKGIKQGNSHLLNWKVTCISTPSTTMVLQRSSNGQLFTDINSITADAARCNQPFTYTDAAPLPGINYYRLKITDADGKVSYSATVALLNETKGIRIISIAPNPVVNQTLLLNITSAKTTQLGINIFDMQGRLVSRQALTLIAGYSSLPVQVGSLAPGTYTIGTFAEGEQAIKIRFVKQ
ncbi:MAG: T9SS type A sorting domain-containing protein [Ferruginibacter sp.]|nr:T9SS type A sorting domain-containing protein [Ferruginibacter sp.]